MKKALFLLVKRRWRKSQPVYRTPTCRLLGRVLVPRPWLFPVLRSWNVLLVRPTGPGLRVTVLEERHH
jgi:hypothetical protein